MHFLKFQISLQCLANKGYRCNLSANAWKSVNSFTCQNNETYLNFPVLVIRPSTSANLSMFSTQHSSHFLGFMAFIWVRHDVLTMGYIRTVFFFLPYMFNEPLLTCLTPIVSYCIHYEIRSRPCTS